MSVCAITASTLRGWLRGARLGCDRRRRRQESFSLGDSRSYCNWPLFYAQCYCAWPLRLCSPLYNKCFSPFARSAILASKVNCQTSLVLLVIPVCLQFHSKTLVDKLQWLDWFDLNAVRQLEGHNITLQDLPAKKMGGGGLDSVIDNSKTL